MTLVERLVLLKSYMKSTYNFAKLELEKNRSLLRFDEKALRKSDKEKLENAFWCIGFKCDIIVHFNKISI